MTKSLPSGLRKVLRVYAWIVALPFLVISVLMLASVASPAEPHRAVEAFAALVLLARGLFLCGLLWRTRGCATAPMR